jgi:hypothetical protein
VTSFRLSRGSVFILLGIVLVLLSGMFHTPLIEKRQQENLQQVAPEDTTPLVALTTVAFGGFRGLVADALWIRAAKMQEEGQVFELVQLAQWITQLEPRVPEVWSFQAWNLAYNISVLFPDFEDRWRWVSHGVDLLKQEGLTHNPASASLHWDIGWMYQHKIGMSFDLAHLFYKQRLAAEMQAVLPQGRLSERELSGAQRSTLETDWGMDPDHMRELEASIAFLDWQIPETHSLYWANRGLTLPASEFNIRSLQRMRMQSLVSLMRGGTRLEDEESGQAILLPRPELIPIILDEYLRELKGRGDAHFLHRGFLTFLREALVVSAEYGLMPQALDLYERLAAEVEELAPGRQNFQQFLQGELSQNPATLERQQAMSRVVAMLQRAADPGMSEVRSRGLTRMARQLHRLYQNSLRPGEHRERNGLPPFEMIERLVESQTSVSVD